MQTDPRFYRDRRRDSPIRPIHFDALAPNIIVKIPATAAGIPAIEEATYRGISINATVRFSLPQASRSRRPSSAASTPRTGRPEYQTMGPVCTIMVGRLDDWLKVVADKARISVDPGVSRVGRRRGVQEGLRLFQERGYRIRLLSAAFRNHMHWSEFIGGDVVISPPHAWQKRFNQQRRPGRAACTNRSTRAIVTELSACSPTSAAPTSPTGCPPAEFDDFRPDPPDAAPVLRRLPRPRASGARRPRCRIRRAR